jgi:hypothetical protein
VTDRAGAVALWVEARTGMELVGDDTARPLDEAARRDRQQRLEKRLFP